MVSDSSLPNSGRTVFNLDSHAGIMHILASVRASEASSNQKNEIRDLIFLYTNGGKDQTVRLALEQKIVAYQIKPTVVKEVKMVVEQPTIGKFRITPAFAVKTVLSQPSVEPPTKSTFTANTVWSSPEPTATVLEPVAATQKMVAEDTLVEPAVPTPVVDILSAPDLPKQSQFLDRIREIKALVNEKVGNPVNLVDINNEVGREYMSALLDAMKKINSGSSAGLAMERLETAYLAVGIALKEHVIKSEVPKVVSSPEVKESEPSTMTVPEPEVFRVPIQKYNELVPTPVAPRTGPLPVETVVAEESNFQASPAQPISNNSVSYPPQSIPANTIPVGRFPSLAEMSDRPKTLTDVPTLDSHRAGTTVGDPFYSKEVDDGLDQLLSEWSIFKKSGLFGTGPKGKEHPLFKKMAELQIPLLLAGRFEGATQEIKQSVTDYMNGWRYEQGLIYQQGETFEHYLRRVIRHILDLQNNRR